jgi:hypothetical protein
MDSHPTFRILLNACSHSGASFGSGCDVTLRVRDVAGPVTGAVIVGQRMGQRVLTDTYGRAVTIIGKAQSEEYTVEAADHESGRFTLECEFFGRINKEVVLEKR